MMDMNDDGSESDLRSTVSSSSRAERRRISRDAAENHRIHPMSKEEKWGDEADAIQDKRSDEFRAKVARDFDYMAVNDAKENAGSWRSKRGAGVRNGDTSEMNGFQGAQRMYDEGMRYSNEGSSNFLPKSSHMDELNAVDYAGRDRAVQLDELKDQFTRPDNLSKKGKEQVPFGEGVAHPEPYVSKHSNVDAFLGMNRGALRHSHADSQIRRPTYQTLYDDPPPVMRRQEMGRNGYFPPQYPPSHDLGYGDSLRSRTRNPVKAPALYQYQPSHAYIPERYRRDGMVYTDSMHTYAPNVSRHHPSCSCFQCSNKREVPPHLQSSAYSDKYSDVRNDMMSDNYGNHDSFGQPEYNRRMSKSSSSARSQNPQLNTRWPGDAKPEGNAGVRSHPHRVRITSGGRHCHPMAGGAPFLMCQSCFELLQLPKKMLSQTNERRKMRCGACSTVILFTVSNKNLVVSIDDVEEVDAPVKVGNNTVMLPRQEDDRVNQVRTKFPSDDFEPMDRELGQISTDNGRDNKLMDLTNRHSKPDTETSSGAPEGPNSIEMPARSKGSSAPAGSLVGESFGYSNEYHGVISFGESDKILPSKTSARQISMNDSSPVTEIDISTNEYVNTGTTFDSGEVNGRQGGRGADSFFAGTKGRMFKHHSSKTDQTDEPETASVTVNGHLVSDRLIKKAERLAGPIHPGHYWYDFRAGFWGVMGGPCLGIIPPFIPEFQHHLPENCSNGNTRVYVNGRELGQKDLNLLGRRGMPTERDRSYILEMSGRILDEDTGEELTGLGKLAPTVEKAKHGFGMRDPNEAAQPTAV